MPHGRPRSDGRLRRDHRCLRRSRNSGDQHRTHRRHRRLCRSRWPRPAVLSESVSVSGQFGTSAQADYYESGVYAPRRQRRGRRCLRRAMQDMTRGYFDATQPWPNQWFYVPFPVKTFGALHVYESRHHYEVNASAGKLGLGVDRPHLVLQRERAGSMETRGHDTRRHLRFPHRRIQGAPQRRSRPGLAQGDGWLRQCTGQQPDRAAHR